MTVGIEIGKGKEIGTENENGRDREVRGIETGLLKDVRIDIYTVAII